MSRPSFDSYPDRLTLRSGRVLDIYRSRWDGVLDREELDFCRQHGIPVGYDCAQIGWVTETCTDDAPEGPTVGDRPSEDASTTSDPERRATQICLHVQASAERVLQDVRDGRQSLEVGTQQLALVATKVLQVFAEQHDINTTDLCHWALESVVAAAIAEVRDSRSDRRRALDEVGFAFRPWVPDDAAVHLALLGNPNVWEHLPEPFPAPFTMETTHTLIEVAAVSFKHDAVAVEVDGRPIGQCLLRFDRPFAGARAAEVAYWLGEEHWGKGWMRRILPAFTLRSFRRHPVDVVYAWIKPENEASVRAAERAGYQRDHFPREAELAARRGRAGFVRYATHRPDWTS